MQRKRINGEVLTLEEAYLKHHRLIWDIAHKFRERGERMGFDVEDLASAGKIGFIKAYEKFDEKSNKRFSTFAQPTIAGHVLMELNRKDVNERISLDVKNKAAAFADMEIENISVSKIMDALQIRYKYAYEVFHYLVHRHHDSLQKPLTFKQGASKVYLSDILPREEDFTSPIVEDYESLFTEKEKVVYDLVKKGYDQKEIQYELGVARSTVTMRLVRMREKIKECLANG